jgi:hypothetical protein
MKKVSEYRKHAEECIRLARWSVKPEHRDLLLQMAQTWNSLAEDRERHITQWQTHQAIMEET